MQRPTSIHPRLLAFADHERSPLSIRARALVFVDPRSRRLQADMERLAPGSQPLLIVGEPGTGKELLARRVHQSSERPGLFVAVNCGGLSRAHGEAELFGHPPGHPATGAGGRSGWLGSANGGTLYLDEIADLSRPLQARLLEVLETREVRRATSERSRPVDVRLVAATSIDLARAAAAGTFDARLYRYLAEGQLDLPPLRQRPRDILPLAEYFLGVYADRLGLAVPQIDDSARWLLEAHAWPGNTRELENVVHFALLIGAGERLLAEHLPIAAQPLSLDQLAGQLARLSDAEIARLGELLHARKAGAIAI